MDRSISFRLYDNKNENGDPKTLIMWLDFVFAGLGKREFICSSQDLLDE